MEKGTLTNRRKFVDSGLANKRAVHIDVDDNGTPVLMLKNDRDEDMRKPDKMWRTISLAGGVRKACKKTETALAMYKPAATKLACRKVSATYRAEMRAKKGINHKNVKTGRGSRPSAATSE